MKQKVLTFVLGGLICAMLVATVGYTTYRIIDHFNRDGTNWVLGMMRQSDKDYEDMLAHNEAVLAARRLEELRALEEAERLAAEKEAQEAEAARLKALEEEQQKRYDELASRLDDCLENCCEDDSSTPILGNVYETYCDPQRIGIIYFADDGSRTYSVGCGDTMQSIAKAVGVTVNELYELNVVNFDNPLYVGRMLILP